MLHHELVEPLVPKTLRADTLGVDLQASERVAALRAVAGAHVHEVRRDGSGEDLLNVGVGVERLGRAGDDLRARL